MTLAGRLLAIDVDGTLIDHDGSLSARTADAVAAAVASGAIVTLATGRDWNAVVGLLAALPDVGYAVCINGVEIFDRAGCELWAGALDLEVARRAVETLRVELPGVAIGAGINGDLLGERALHAAMPPGLADPVVVDDIVAHLGAGLRDLVLYHPVLAEELDTFFERVATALAGEDAIQVAYTGLPMIELTPPGSGKHTGLAWLAEYLGVDPGDVVAIGDGRNDISMLEWAGTGVAMGDASADVRHRADEVTLGVGEDGLAHWIERALAIG